MTEYSFFLKIKGIKNTDIKNELELLLEGDSSSIVLQENRRREFGSDTYLGLIAVALCGNSAFEWIEDAFWRSYIAGHYTEGNTLCIQVTLGDVEEDCWTRLVKNSNEDIEIELTVDEDDDFAVEEYGEGFTLKVSSDGKCEISTKPANVSNISIDDSIVEELRRQNKSVTLLEKVKECLPTYNMSEEQLEMNIKNTVALF